MVTAYDTLFRKDCTVFHTYYLQDKIDDALFVDMVDCDHGDWQTRKINHSLLDAYEIESACGNLADVEYNQIQL